MFITWVVPHGLPVGKVEIVNLTCDVLAGDEQRSEVSPCSGPKLLRKKRKTNGEKAEEKEEFGERERGREKMGGEGKRGKD